MVEKPFQHPKDRLVKYFADVERSVTGQTPKSPAQSQQELEDRLAQFTTTKRLAWLSRPRLHTAIFAEAWFDDEVAKLGGKAIGATKKSQRERAQKITAIARKLRWSKERVNSFKKVVVQYRKSPTLKNYLQVRQEFPEVEIQIASFGGIDPLFSLEKEFQLQGIDPHLIAACLDSDEPSIDALCLRLMEKLVEREKSRRARRGISRNVVLLSATL
jgi:hypothetical protein